MRNFNVANTHIGCTLEVLTMTYPCSDAMRRVTQRCCPCLRLTFQMLNRWQTSLLINVKWNQENHVLTREKAKQSYPWFEAKWLVRSPETNERKYSNKRLTIGRCKHVVHRTGCTRSTLVWEETSSLKRFNYLRLRLPREQNGSDAEAKARNGS